MEAEFFMHIDTTLVIISSVFLKLCSLDAPPELKVALKLTLPMVINEHLSNHTQICHDQIIASSKLDLSFDKKGQSINLQDTVNLQN